jgi:hypothetical protein
LAAPEIRIARRARTSETAVIGEIFVKRLRLIGTLSDDDANVLVGLKGRVRDVARGEVLLRQGVRATESVAVAERASATPHGDAISPPTRLAWRPCTST